MAHRFADEWSHGASRVFARAAKGGLVAAVVEAWFPADDHSYGLLLEDDIEVSPFFYLYLKQALLQYVYADDNEGGGGGTAPSNILGISLYTPRLVEVRLPRRSIDLYSMLPPFEAGGGGLFLQQLPCSWGSLFFPRPWLEFHQYMFSHLHGDARPVYRPGARCPRALVPCHAQ